MPTHTQGIWRAYKDRVYAMCRDGREREIFHTDSPYVEDAAANARIAAAAPELYEALRLFLEDPRFQVAVGGNPIAVDEMMAQARAALAKASAQPTR